MPSKDPIWIGRDLRYLVPTQLEARLARARVLLNERRGWSPAARERGIFFDLSQLEWVELGALVQVVLLVESASKTGVHVSLALPLKKMHLSERHRLEDAPSADVKESVRRRVDLRLRVHSYLKHLRFLEALASPHINSGYVRIIEGFDPGEGEAPSRGKVVARSDEVAGGSKLGEEWPLNEPQYQHVFPLTWFSVDDTAKLRDLSWALAKVIGAPTRGLEPIDASTLANVILYELVENVRDHALGSGWALVAVWARPERYPAKPFNYLICERPYLDWAIQGTVPVVEIVVGDSGVGVYAALRDRFREACAEGLSIWPNIPSEERQVLLWAFDRWSTSKSLGKSRGTRGLYRVDRVVRKYQGMLTLRSGSALVGLDHGGAAYDSAIFENGKLCQFPGTLLRVRMPAFRDELIPRRAESRLRPSLAFVTLSFDRITRDSFGDSHRAQLTSAIRMLPTDRSWCLIITVRGVLGSPKGVEMIIREAVELRHPVTLVLLGLPGGGDLIENAVDSVNAEFEERDLGHEGRAYSDHEVWDPVLIISETTRHFWAGATADEIRLLNALSESPSGTLQADAVVELVPDSGRRRTILRAFRNDTSLIRLKDDGSVEIAVTVAGIVNEVAKLLLDHVVARRQGVRGGGPFRTPTLHVVDFWLDVEEVFRSIGVNPVLAGFSLASLVRRHISGMGAPLELIVDSSVAVERARFMASYLGAGVPHMMPIEARESGLASMRLVSRGVRVVIHCDVLLSEEAARRCLSQVLRDDAVPIALTCVFDARPASGKVELWGVEVPVFSLARLQMLVEDGEYEDIRNVNPITRLVEREEEAGILKREPMPREQLWEIIENARALHFTHLSRKSGRHFTFFLDADKVALDPVALHSFQREVLDWVESSRLDPSNLSVDLWYPTTEPRLEEPAGKIAQWLYHQAGRLFLPPRSVSREPAFGRWMFAGPQESRPRRDHVVIVDWGALTGNSVMQMVRLAAEGGARNVLCVVFLSQMPDEDRMFLQSISSLNVNSRLGPTVEQITLPGFGSPEEMIPEVERKVDISIRFLSSLSLSAYAPHDCPVCWQLERLSDEQYPTILLKNFAVRQKERLKSRSAEEVLKDEPVDVDGRRLASDAAIWMSSFRMELAYALISTSRRLLVHQNLLEIQAKIQERGTTLPGHSLWLVLFLSIESQWLKRPPLQFKNLRSIVATIAYEIAVRRDVSDNDRLNAVAVLRTASKFLFARRLYSLFESALESERVLQQILYDIFTYSSRPYHQTLGVLSPLRAELGEIVGRISTGEFAVSLEVASTAERLLERVEREFARVEAQSLSLVGAWRKLRRAFKREFTGRHDSLTEKMNNVLPRVLAEDVDAAIAAKEKGEELPLSFEKYVITWLDGVRESWLPCRRFLDVEVLPFIRPLQKVFQSVESIRFLGEDNSARLVDLASSRMLVSEGGFSSLVEDLGVDKSALLVRRQWDFFREEAEWFWHMLFKAGDAYGNSVLYGFLDDCPANVFAVIERAYEQVRRRLPFVNLRSIEGREISRGIVFCTKELVRDAVKHILENCQKHRAGDDAVEVRVRVFEHAGRTIIRFLNNRTLSRRPPGRGLEKLRRRLEGFDGELVATPRASAEWASYEVRISLLSWR